MGEIDQFLFTKSIILSNNSAAVYKIQRGNTNWRTCYNIFFAKYIKDNSDLSNKKHVATVLFNLIILNMVWTMLYDTGIIFISEIDDDIIIIIIISHGLSIYTRSLLSALHTPPVVPRTMPKVTENVIILFFVSSSSYVF